MFVKFYDRLDLSRADLDDVLIVPANRAKALDVARERHLPRQSLTRATTREGFWVYVFQLRADIHLGAVTLAGAQPGPENVVTLPVRQLDRYSSPGMPLTEMAGLLAAVAEDYPPTGLTALLADSLTRVLDLWADACRNGRPTIDIRDLDRAVTSEFAPAVWSTPSSKAPTLTSCSPGRDRIAPHGCPEQHGHHGHHREPDREAGGRPGPRPAERSARS